MNLMKKLLVGAVLAAAAVMPAAGAGPAGNKKCPMSRDSADPCISVQFQGRTVTFCCADCVGQWEKLSRGEQEARLAAVSSDPGTAGASADARECPQTGPCFPAEPWPYPPGPGWPYPKRSQPWEPWCGPVTAEPTTSAPGAP
jgi:hypothetical protein